MDMDLVMVRARRGFSPVWFRCSARLRDDGKCLVLHPSFLLERTRCLVRFAGECLVRAATRLHPEADDRANRRAELTKSFKRASPCHPKLWLKSVVTWNISPAPSQSLVVTTGVCTHKKRFSLKNECVANVSSLLIRATAAICKLTEC
jgi:hypothetical protein